MSSAAVTYFDSSTTKAVTSTTTKTTTTKTATTTTTLSPSEISLELQSTVMYYLSAVINPISILIGLPATFIIIGIMPFTKVSRKTRLFYVSIAVTNLGHLISTQLLIFFFAYTTKVMFGYSPRTVQNMSSIACKISRYASNAGNNMSSYITLFFSIERLIAIRFPFKAHLFTYKVSAICIAAIIAEALGVHSTAFLLYDKVPGVTCSPQSDASTILLIAYLISSVIPNCLLMISASLTLFYLVKSSRKTAHATSGLTERAMAKKKKSNTATVVLLILAGVRCVGYVPHSITYVVFGYIPDEYWSKTIRYVSNDFDFLCGLNGVGDFIAYVSCIAAFREKLRQVFCCKCETKMFRK